MMEVDEDSKRCGGGGDTLKRRASSLSSSQEDVDTVSGEPTNNTSQLAGDPAKVDGIQDNVADNSKRVKTRTNRSSPNEADEAGSESPVIPEKLEVPSKELQCIQKQVLIEKLMGTTTTTTKIVVEGDEPMDVQSDSTPKISNKSRKQKQFRVPTKPPSLSHEDFKRTFKVRPSLLDRVKTFLPELKNSNEELLRLPDPSKISLESDSDEIDGAVAGPSGASDSKDEIQTTTGEDDDHKPYVEMKFALLEQSDSDTSSDDEGVGSSPSMASILPEHLKGLPSLGKKESLVSVVDNDDTIISNTISTEESPPPTKDAMVTVTTDNLKLEPLEESQKDVI